ncbi:MAG: RNA-binding protein [Hyphomicrobiaceae bacterium]|nr:RNA-binding protein [Hyphomicrobiaceae bacterium]
MPRRSKVGTDIPDVTPAVADAVESCLASGAEAAGSPDDGKDKAAQSLGRRGGKARAAKMSPARRSEIARNAALKRWSRKS